MQFEFKYSKQTEIDRIIFTYGSIVKGIYQKLGFILTEHTPINESDNVVVIPSPKPILFPKIIKILEKENLCAGVYTDISELQEFFRQEFSSLELIDQEHIERMEKEWKKSERKVLELINILFPHNGFEKVEIIPTLYGTAGSYHARNKTIYLNIRVDKPTSYIIPMLIRAIVHYSGLNIKTEDETYLNRNQIWTKKEEFTDILMKTSALKFLYPNYRSTLESLANPEIDEKLVKESTRLYNKLGFPIEKALKLNGLVIKLYDKKISNFTKTQNKLLINFLKKEGDVVKNEEIAEIMWGKDSFDKFSLSAMAKMIHQLRQKLKDAGLQKEVIFTKRGKGYVLVQ